MPHKLYQYIMSDSRAVLLTTCSSCMTHVDALSRHLRPPRCSVASVLFYLRRLRLRHSGFDIIYYGCYSHHKTLCSIPSKIMWVLQAVFEFAFLPSQTSDV